MDNLARLKHILELIFETLGLGARVVGQIYRKIWFFLRSRIPFLSSLAQRHISNPSTVFIDAAIFVLVVYLGFGVFGFTQIYSTNPQSRLATNLSELYPFPAAKVDATFIWTHQFLTRLKFLGTFSAQAPTDLASRPPTDSELRTRVLEGLIEDRVVYLAAKKRRVRVTSEELETAFVKQGDSKEIAKKVEELYGMTIVEYKSILAEQILKEKLKNSVLVRVKLRHILTLDLTSANVAKAQISQGRDFAEVAREFSQDDKSAASGGDIGYWRLGELATQIAPAVEDATAKMSVSQVSEPVQTQFGFQIIQLLERSDGANQSYEAWYKEALAKHKVKRYVKT